MMCHNWNGMETDKSADLNLKINEIKKRILLAEGQKTAHVAEWQKQNQINKDTIAKLKKEIKELNVKVAKLRNPLQYSVLYKEHNEESRAKSVTPTIMVGKVSYPIGAKNVDDALFLTDLKITENRKQLDLLKHRFKSRKKHLTTLIERCRHLQANKESQIHNLGEKPPETIEEDSNRKLVCQLENQIHRTTVQWMEAEHIRKKYRCIQASLMNDAERFERSLHELETSLNEQKAEIKRLQAIHNEAVEMRETTKVVLLRQEQHASVSQKTRERQAIDFRKQLEARKLELERIGRKLFEESKTLVHQDSTSSSSGDPHTAKTENEEEPVSQLESVSENMEILFKQLMEASGAKSPQEVLERFRAQKESAARLNYLRQAAEKEKATLEAERESLINVLETSKFIDMKENEVNQELIEKMKNDIAEMKTTYKKNLEAAEKTMAVLKFLKERLCEMIFKMQEVDESNIELKQRNLYVRVSELPNFLMNEANDEDLIEILKLKISSSLEIGKPNELPPMEVPKLEIEEVQPSKLAAAPEDEKPQPMPRCYYNLFAGRAQPAAGTSSSSPEQAPTAVPAADEENEVPSRNYLKRQSVLIVDAKSRRKPFKTMPGARRK